MKRIKKVILLAMCLAICFIPQALCGDPIETENGVPCCPALYVYSNGEYVYETLFEVESSEDITLQYTLTVIPDDIDGIYKIVLHEGGEGSEIDKVQLTSDGRHVPLLKAVLADELNVKSHLSASDDYKATLQHCEWIIMEFKVLPDMLNLTFHIEGRS